MTNATDVKYQTRSVKTVRGLEARTRAKVEKEGWEFVSQTQGTIRSELTFRRPTPKVPWKLIGIGGGVFAVLIAFLLVMGAISGEDDASVVASPSPAPSQAAPMEEPTEASTASPELAEPAPVAAPATDITVDELLDKLNSAQMGGLTVGDRFHLTGELFHPEYWMTGASGDYFVMLKAQGGAQDLTVFANESDAAAWHEGTKVDMIVETVEATINGETTQGWLRATTVTVIP